MREARAKFGIIWVPDGRLFAIGGKVSSGGSTSTVEMLDTTNQISTSNAVWKSVASMSNPRESHGVAFLDGKLVAVGGTNECSVEVFTLPTKDNALGQWSTIYPLPSPFALQALLPADNLLIGICESVSVLSHFTLVHGLFNPVFLLSVLSTCKPECNIGTAARRS